MTLTLSQLKKSDLSCKIPENLITDKSFEAIHYRLYAVLYFYKTLTPQLEKEILDFFSIDKTTLVNALNFMESKGLVSKTIDSNNLPTWIFIEQEI